VQPQLALWLHISCTSDILGERGGGRQWHPRRRDIRFIRVSMVPPPRPAAPSSPRDLFSADDRGLRDVLPPITLRLQTRSPVSFSTKGPEQIVTALKLIALFLHSSVFCFGPSFISALSCRLNLGPVALSILSGRLFVTTFRDLRDGPPPGLIKVPGRLNRQEGLYRMGPPYWFRRGEEGGTPHAS